MTNEQKLQILDALIATARTITYEYDVYRTGCIDDAKSFVRNTISPVSHWLKRIDSIKWSSAGEWIESDWNDQKTEFISVVTSIRSEIELYAHTQSQSDARKQEVSSDKVFIVHGHNDEMKLAVAGLVTQLGLNPIILHEQPNKGKTIIEKFETLSEDISFAIVLLSADDEMCGGKFRARQNVVLELGYFIAKLGRENVVALYNMSSSEVEIPSDITGILYEPYDNSKGAWRLKIIQELKAAGFAVDANSLI
jgi:predicted nucleotide-binding protein